jgi:hypothetical protein
MIDIILNDGNLSDSFASICNNKAYAENNGVHLINQKELNAGGIEEKKYS